LCDRKGLLCCWILSSRLTVEIAAGACLSGVVQYCVAFICIVFSFKAPVVRCAGGETLSLESEEKRGKRERTRVRTRRVTVVKRFRAT